ncbi:MAG: hypothetical protein HOD11_04080 [Candidatus Marinimicrobia bacterium]|nr:hypothetical protein [Candidatus Neomarinimicrobiota bacterium]
MKTKYIISILILSLSLVVIGQTTIHTPWGTSVSVTEPDEGDLSGRLYWEDLRRGQWPNADYKTTWPVTGYPNLSSTFRFNCHGYAWHMFWFGEDYELDEPVKMEYTEAGNYFNDHSFKECTQAEADIWWINGGSHSAVATDNPAFLKSKWADGPLATHRIAESPYPPNMSYTTFYKKCLYESTGTIYTDNTMVHCAVRFDNTIVSNYVDLEIVYEEGVLIVGTFSTGTGATLYFHPD